MKITVVLGQSTATNLWLALWFCLKSAFLLKYISQGGKWQAFVLGVSADGCCCFLAAEPAAEPREVRCSMSITNKICSV